MASRVLRCIFISFFYLVLSSCQSSDHRAIELKTYLKQNYNMDAKDGELYLFIPAVQCDNCFAIDGSKLSKRLNKKLHIFSAFSPKNIKSFKNYHHDKDEKLKKLIFITYNSQLVFFEKNKINAVVELVSL
ncbi:MAG TPA: hypothetical protein PL029_03880 [Bacteroidia bacterium]|nr:hypothetical protein [Bacteroidia bacterium]